MLLRFAREKTCSFTTHGLTVKPALIMLSVGIDISREVWSMLYGAIQASVLNPSGCCEGTLPLYQCYLIAVL